MICYGCIHFAPVSAKNPIAPACTWRPGLEDSWALKRILPAPALSRALVMPTPIDVGECPQFTEA